MVVANAGAGLPPADNDAAALCRVATAQDCWLGSMRVPTKEDAALPRHNVTVRPLVFARQGRARTLSDGVLGEGLLLDGDGVGGDQSVFVIIECEHLGRDFHADRVSCRRAPLRRR